MNKKHNICAVCGGLLVKKQIRFDHRWGQDIVLFEDVPVNVCAQCDETWLDAKVLNKMDKILKRKQKPYRKLVVPVWSLGKSNV